MDQKLVAWARAVKARHRHRKVPPLWLFTDADRGGDPIEAVARLPRGLCGVVFRHDGVAERSGLARRVARLCRQRRLVMVIAGTRILLAHVARHCRGGWGHGCGSASAHSRVDLVRARRSRASVVFLSPAYPTRSHAGAVALGPIRWAAMARGHRAVLALGGIDGETVRRLPRWAAGAGAIGALGG